MKKKEFKEKHQRHADDVKMDRLKNTELRKKRKC